MRRFFLIFMCACALGSYGKTHAQQDVATQQKEADVLLADLDTAPQAGIDAPRELPWYIRLVERPGLYAYMKFCTLRDWADYNYERTRRAVAAIWLYLRTRTVLRHVRGKQKQPVV